MSPEYSLEEPISLTAPEPSESLQPEVAEALLFEMTHCCNAILQEEHLARVKLRFKKLLWDEPLNRWSLERRELSINRERQRSQIMRNEKLHRKELTQHATR